MRDELTPQENDQTEQLAEEQQEKSSEKKRSTRKSSEEAVAALAPFVGNNQELAEFLVKCGVSGEPSQAKTLSQVIGAKEALLFGEDAKGGISLFIPALFHDLFLIEQEKSDSTGTTLVVTPEAEVQNVIDQLGKAAKRGSSAKLKAAKIEEDAAPGHVIVGAPSEAVTFLGSDTARATDIRRVIIHVVAEGEEERVKEVLQSACKRGRRPQLLLIEESPSAALTDGIRGIFQVSAQPVVHLYHEVSGELLAKPQALSDILEGDSVKASLIFCNQPSDTDLLEVVLRKRGIAARKLVGHVPSQKVTQSVAAAKNGEIRALIVTDVSGRDIDVGEFEQIINYAIPSDPEVYVHRTEPSGGAIQLRRVVNLVGPLDRANFHYLKKIVESEFQKYEPPSAEEVARARYDGFRTQALAKATAEDETVKSFVQCILKDADKEGILSYLVGLALHGAPVQKSAPAEGEYTEDRRGRGKPERGERRGHERGRNGRGREAQEDMGDSSDEESAKERKPRIQYLTKKFARVYVGQGTKHGFSQEKLSELVQGQEGIQAQHLLRSNIRPNYTFVDVEEDAADILVNILEEHLEGTLRMNGVRKALSLSVSSPIEASAGQTETNNSDEEPREPLSLTTDEEGEILSA